MCGSLVRGFRPHHVWRRRRSRCACILTCLWDVGNGGFRRRDGIGTKGHVGGRSWVLLMALLGKVGRKGMRRTQLLPPTCLFATEELSRVAATAVDTDNGIVTESASANPSEHQPSEDPALSAHPSQQSHEEDPAPSSNMSLRADPVPPAEATISDIPEASQDAGASGSATSPNMVGTEASNQRPTHSGKSLELLGLAGMKVTRRVNLKMGRSRRDDGDEYEDSGVEGSADEMEVDSEPKEKQSRPPRKKRRIVSAATIGSEEEPAPKGPKRKPKADEERKDKWPTYVSRPRCSRCMRSGLRSRTFVLPQRGPPRFACEHCHQRKQQCPLTAPRRLAYSQGQLLDGG